MDEETQANLIKLVQGIVPSAIHNPQSSKGTVSFTLPFSSKEKFYDLFRELEKDSRFQINLEMNTLEDAFVNIGMDEDKYLGTRDKKGSGAEESEEKYTDFSSIVPPECLKEPPQYDFFVQFVAMFKRKLKMTMKAKGVAIGIGMPVFFQLMGFAMIKGIINQISVDNPQIE